MNAINQEGEGTGVNEAQNELLEMQASLCQALSDPKRLRILYRLAEGEVSVGEIAQDLGLSMANISQHLGVLRARGLVRSRREGTSILYGVAHPEIMEACRTLRAVIARQLEEGSRLAGLLETLKKSA